MPPPPRFGSGQGRSPRESIATARRLRVLPVVVVMAWLFVALAFAGCAMAEPVRQVVATSTPDGDDVFCTAAAFRHRFPELGRSTAAIQMPPMTGSRSYSSAAFSPGAGLGWVLGAYDLRDPHTCWAIAAEPAHPTADEHEVMEHENCHRWQNLYGWEAAAPLWAELYHRAPWAMTHREIRSRLIAEGYLP